MSPDPIVQEVRRIREAYAALFNFDLHAICRDLREKEKSSGRMYVTLTPRVVESPPALPAAAGSENPTASKLATS